MLEACSSSTSSPVFGLHFSFFKLSSQKVILTLLMLISFCVKYIVCFGFDSVSAHIHYINAMKLNFTILCCCALFLSETQTDVLYRHIDQYGR